MLFYQPHKRVTISKIKISIIIIELVDGLNNLRLIKNVHLKRISHVNEISKKVSHTIRNEMTRALGHLCAHIG